MQVMNGTHNEIEEVIRAAYRVSNDIGREVEAVLAEGRERPLSRDEAAKLLRRVITVLRDNASRRGDQAALRSLTGDINNLVERIIQARDDPSLDRHVQSRPANKRLELVSRDGIEPAPLFPRPWFHGRDIPMNAGFVRVTDIELWADNDRLDIHVNQFQRREGHRPSGTELLDIMLSKMNLPGVTAEDEFAIVDLARSIAVNGVRKAPILDLDGTLLDGNRRVAACYFILNSDEFDTEQKRRVEYIYVWQLTEHATPDDRTAVVVSLNFEPDHKQQWPEYVKARRVSEEWQAMLASELRSPGSQRQAQMKRELSVRFALGPDTSVVNRYLKMVEWANQFEAYHTIERKRDTYEVKHRANRYFQYFDELAKGTSPGGVAYALNQDDGFKHLVFDLLYDGKFRNWRQIRELKLINDSQEARDALNRARMEPDEELAEEHLENAFAIARSRRAEAREVGVNTRIESFCTWLEEVPPRAFRDAVSLENLRRLHRALSLVDGLVSRVLAEREGKA